MSHLWLFDGLDICKGSKLPNSSQSRMWWKRMRWDCHQMIRKRTLATVDKKELISISEEGLSTVKLHIKDCLQTLGTFCFVAMFPLLQLCLFSTKCISWIEILLSTLSMNYSHLLNIWTMKLPRASWPTSLQHLIKQVEVTGCRNVTTSTLLIAVKFYFSSVL